MRTVITLLLICLFSARRVHSFTAPKAVAPAVVRSGSTTTNPNQRPLLALQMAPKDPSRSGTKRDRMDKLAEMEKLGAKSEGDNSVFIKAAGGFVAFIVIAIAAAASSGLLTQY